MAFEYLLVRRETGEIAAAQVKTGASSLNRDDYKDYPHRVILFQANDHYAGGEYPNVACVKSEEVREFLSGSLNWLPRVFIKKMLLAEPALAQMRSSNAERAPAGREPLLDS